jgi:hypothetical protein
MLDLEHVRSAEDDQLFDKLFKIIMSGEGENRKEVRLLEDGKEILKIEVDVKLTRSELRKLRWRYTQVKEYLEDTYRSDEIGKTYPGIDKIRYDELWSGVRISILFKGTPVFQKITMGS